MALPQWTERLSVGIPQMDKQHQQLLQMFHRLRKLVCENATVDELGPIIRDLLEATAAHCHDEEELLRRHKYPPHAGHTRVHQEIIASLRRDYLHPLAKGKLKLYPHTVDAIADLLITHIRTEDRKYGAYLAARQVTPKSSTPVR